MTLILSVLISAYLLAGIIYFGFKKQGNNPLRHTISELGEIGTPFTKPVRYGLFLPVGILLLGITAFATSPSLHGLSACLGIGYAVAAFFPCDVGSPSIGSGRQQIHNLGGAVEYAGGIYFILQSSTPTLLWMDTKIVGYILMACFVLISFQSPIRGGVQRIAEAILFSSLIQLAAID